MGVRCKGREGVKANLSVIPATFLGPCGMESSFRFLWIMGHVVGGPFMALSSQLESNNIRGYHTIAFIVLVPLEYYCCIYFCFCINEHTY